MYLVGRLRCGWQIQGGWREPGGGWLQVFLHQIIIAILVGNNIFMNLHHQKIMLDMKEKGKMLSRCWRWRDGVMITTKTAESYFVVFQQLIHGTIQMMKKKH